MGSSYAFDNAWQHAHQRLQSLEALADPGSIRHLQATGISDGWRCLEVGAGAGSIVRWMSEQVGPSGKVVATDINPRFLPQSEASPIEVHRHDITSDPLPEAAFDLAHIRMVLAHLPRREQALERMVSALSPGGWLVVEELDFSSVHPTPDNSSEDAERFRKVAQAHQMVVEQRGFDTFYGRRLLDDLRKQDLRDVETEGRATICTGGSPWALSWRFTCQQLWNEMVATEIIEPGDLDRVIEQLDDGRFSFMSQIIMSAWGRRAA